MTIDISFKERIETNHTLHYITVTHKPSFLIYKRKHNMVIYRDGTLYNSHSVVVRRTSLKCNVTHIIGSKSLLSTF